MDINEVPEAIGRIDHWLDSEISEAYKNQPLAQDIARVAKAAEEAGEAFQAFLDMTGQNPRKGVCGTKWDLYDELADVVIAGMLGINHFTKNEKRTIAIILERLEYRLHKMPEGY